MKRKQKIKNAKGDILFHLEDIESDILQTQIENNRNRYLLKVLDAVLRKISHAKRLANADPRYLFKVIENEMERLYKNDRNLGGFNITLIYNEELKDNMGKIKIEIKEQS